MVVSIGDVIKYHINFMEHGVCIQQGRVCVIKEGFFSKTYLVELKRPTDFNTSQARWVNEKNIIEVVEPIKEGACKNG